MIIYIISMLCIKIKEGLLQYDPYIDKLKRKLMLVNENASRLEFYHDTKSFTINKQQVHLCLKDEHGNYYDENMLLYVALHELSHVICDEIGHTPKFWAIFDKVLEKASKIIDPETGVPIYDPNGPIVQDYCDSEYHNKNSD